MFPKPLKIKDKKIYIDFSSCLCLTVFGIHFGIQIGIQGNMPYVVHRGKKYHYSRRVPTEIRSYDNRHYVRISLKTDSREEAEIRSYAINKEVESYWRQLIASGKKHSNHHFRETVKLARLLGFSYMPASKLANQPLHEIASRAFTIAEHGYNTTHMEALGGGVNEPEIMLSDCLEHYWEFSRDQVMSKSESQKRKWRSPRIKAVNNFILLTGDKPVNSIIRNDIVRFRNWWLDRIEDEDLANGSANKDFIYLRGVLRTVCQNLEITLPVDDLFQRITLKEIQKSPRLPFSTSFIRKMFDENKFEGMNTEAKLAVCILAETGMRISELTGLKPEDIVIGKRLENEIQKAKNASVESNIPPHIKIRPHKGRELKTDYSKRNIPLTGWALWAFEQIPNGLERYAMKNDNLSCCINKYMQENNLFPSENHSLYSFRHSFQDRMTEIGMPDRIQTQLFGHKFNRPDYGQGASLHTLKVWMQKIQLKE